MTRFNLNENFALERLIRRVCHGFEFCLLDAFDKRLFCVTIIVIDLDRVLLESRWRTMVRVAPRAKFSCSFEVRNGFLVCGRSWLLNSISTFLLWNQLSLSIRYLRKSDIHTLAIVLNEIVLHLTVRAFRGERLRGYYGVHHILARGILFIAAWCGVYGML